MILLDHIVLNATDVEKTTRFYQHLLDVPTENWQDFIDGKTKFPSLRLSDTFIIDVFGPPMWEKRQKGEPAATLTGNNLNHFCVAVTTEHWQRIFAYVAQQQIDILRGPDEYWGAQGYGVSFYVADPDGNEIEIRKYE